MLQLDHYYCCYSITYANTITTAFTITSAVITYVNTITTAITITTANITHANTITTTDTTYVSTNDTSNDITAAATISVDTIDHTNEFPINNEVIRSQQIHYQPRQDYRNPEFYSSCGGCNNCT